ncbi:MAG: M15 family metallopeptidase [Clostridia bacterium]|nr:M15 family metallopeptidase [Clostridia bacterium]
MKKTLTAILLGILAVILVGCVIFAIKDNSKPSISTGEPNSLGESAISDKSDTDKYEEMPSDGTSSDTESTLSEAASDAKPSESAKPTNTTSKPADNSEYAYAYAGFSPAYADMNVADWKLILVNRDYILPDGYKPKLENAVDDGYGDIYLDERVAPHYNRMYEAAYKDGIHLAPISGYRSVDRQKRNFENKIDYYMDKGYSKVEATQKAATIILPPGTSEHNAGLAMDICSLEQNFEDTKEFRWLCENAADYGFILRYPEDKQDITKIIYEPWHWRYVGVDAAREMKASGECLEEYLGLA